MADPFSITTGVLGILSSLIALSQPVIKIVDDFRKSSSEIRYLSRDIRALFSVVRSLDIALREQDIRDIDESDGAIFYQTRNLEDPLRNCRDVLTNLMVKNEELEQRRASISFRKLRWAIFTKGEVRSTQLRLETTKSTLNSALNAVTMYVEVEHGM